jgi:hypothetical protein
MTNSKVLSACAAVNALSAALAAVRAAAGADPDCPAMAAAVAVTEAGLELANQSLDAAIGDEAIEWAPGMFESIAAGG